MKRILVVEDEDAIREFVVINLQRAGYDVVEANSGEAALQKYEENHGEFDVAILDIMMPVLDGLSVLKSIRRRGCAVPVLLLTAKDSIEDRVAGLDAGANDYLVKPFAFEELLARIRVLLRKPAEAPSNCLQTANLKLLLDTHQVFRSDTEIHLSGKEFSLLRYLMQNEGIVLSRDKLEQHIWNYDFTGGSNVIDVYIRYLRRKIDDGFEPKLIHTVRGAGYVLKVAI